MTFRWRCMSKNSRYKKISSPIPIFHNALKLSHPRGIVVNFLIPTNQFRMTIQDCELYLCL